MGTKSTRYERPQFLCRFLEGSVKMCRSNRQISGLENLSELKVLNLASNLIRKLNNLGGLTSLEEINLRRNRIRSTCGLEQVPSLEKLYLSNNELQASRYEAENHRLTVPIEN